MYKQLSFGNKIYEDDWGIIDIIDENKKSTNYIAIRKHIKNFDKLDEILKTKKLIGLSAWQNYPELNVNPIGESEEENNKQYIKLKEYHNKVILWCHCFKDPENFIPPGVPLLLYSDSDQYAHLQKLVDISKKNTNKQYDFFCSLPNGEWNTWIRGIDVARKWLNYMADEMNLKILVGGGDRRPDFSEKIEFTGHLGWDIFLQKMNSCKYLFNASRYDASPRIIIEALCLNLPVLLNKDILGGWKYINKSTGSLFFYDQPIKNTVNRFIKNEYNPQQWMKINFNIESNKKLLASTVNKLMSFKYEDFIDGIIFINLEDRTDRLKLITEEFNRMEIPLNMVHRVEGICNKVCGHLGCTKSHIKALEYAKEMKWKKFLILEDSFIFNLPKERVLYILSEFYKKYNDTWDVFMFTTYWNEKIDTDINFIKKILYGTTTCGYLVNHTYIDTLYDNFSDSMKILEKEVEEFTISNPNEKKFTSAYALDQYWKFLQKRDNFYISQPHIGSRSKSWSSIMTK
jgi:GR25 family glycosyltransferase involved in LPS biosynthesis